MATVSVSADADQDNGGRGLPRGARTPLRKGGFDDGVMGGLIAMEPNHCERFIEHTTQARLTLPPVVGSPPSPAAEETVGGEGDQRHEHDRSEHGGEKHYEQDPQ